MDGIPASEPLPTAIDEAEKTLALKKAYADMILNTAKEAAARVLVAEQKAKKYKKELEFTKQEAVRMLIRMKQTMETENAEAGVKSMNQQKKIKELELQLDEAEEMILDLRAKLTKFQEQSDDAKFQEQAVHSSREKESANQPCCHSSLSDVEFNSRCLDHHSIVHQFPGPSAEHLTSNSDFDRCLVDNPVFDSIYFRKGGPGSCNSECIRKIRAIEKDLIDGRMPLAVNLDEYKSLVLKNEELGVNYSIPSTSRKLGSVDNVAIEKPSLIDSATKDWSQKIQILRRRRTRQVKCRANARGCRYISGRFVKSQRTFSTISRCNAYLPSSMIVDRSGNLSKRNGRNQAEKVFEKKRKDAVLSSHFKEDLSHGKYEPVSVARRSTRKRKVKQWDGFSTLCRRKGANPQENEGSCKKRKEAHCTAECAEHLSEGKYEDHKCGTQRTNNRKCMEASGDSSNAKVSENGSTLIDVPMQVTPMTTELDNVSLTPTDKKSNRMSRLTDMADSEHRSSKSNADTFSRKARKRQNGLLMNNGSGKHTELDLIPQASAVNESLDDSRGLVQIAHQLISLSATGW
ncbi:OLC1v1009442C1 [Oldenlandia corymbosa var. corymbosa]|uniref:OLC1v1009442C1 n=2 Tax=Oldenlandia corymbosa var. corymbosa TaxID=529605 RepID=A0AAV1DP15_OLDCO|nr:OLC1v1009442C1 [Oldenlandia corymbosa var. corymbosa]